MDSILPKLRQLSPGTVIPKPASKGEVTIKGWGKRNGEAALIYCIPNHSKPRKPYEKGITAREWEQAYRRLLTTGEFTREWFNANMPRCSKEGGCNFTTIGGIFSLFGFAAYEWGVYRNPSVAPGGMTASLCRDNGFMAIASPTRHDLVRRGQRLEYFTIAYNSAEGLVSVVAGIVAGSVSLIGFGLDSIIEVASGAAMLWRLHHDLHPSRREQVERTSLRIVGACFIALALYIVCESASALILHESPERSIPGIVVASISVVVMPLLARAKRRIAAGIGSGAMNADSRQADFCTYLSAILLGGLLLNALLGWWWVDPVAGLVMVPIIAKEGVDGIRGKACCDDCGCQ